MNLKSDHVILSNLQPQMLIALMAADEVYRKYDRVLTITSANDSEHALKSFHYSGNAVDLRIQNPINSVQYFSDPQDVCSQIKRKLNVDFDVIYEGDHFHIEYQPRKR